MSRVLTLSILLAAGLAQAQGISGVTRRTPALEKQAVARRFFDAAGVSVTGDGASPVAAPAGTGRPVAMQPLWVRVPPPASVRPQPRALAASPPPALKIGTAPAGTRTNILAAQHQHAAHHAHR